MYLYIYIYVYVDHMHIVHEDSSTLNHPL